MIRNETEMMVYEITIEGRLKSGWADWLNGGVVRMAVSPDESNHTTLTVQVPDQAALRGLMNKLWDLNLKLVSVSSRRLESEVP